MKKTRQSDLLYLADIISYSQKASQFLDKCTFDDFISDEQKVFAVTHAVEIIGEAVGNLSSEFVSMHSNFPSREAIGMRNHLIHGYDKVDLKKLWNTVQDDLPKLIELVQSIQRDWL